MPKADGSHCMSPFAMEETGLCAAGVHTQARARETPKLRRSSTVTCCWPAVCVFSPCSCASSSWIASVRVRVTVPHISSSVGCEFGPTVPWHSACSCSRSLPRAASSLSACCFHCSSSAFFTPIHIIHHHLLCEPRAWVVSGRYLFLLQLLQFLFVRQNLLIHLQAQLRRFGLQILSPS